MAARVLLLVLVLVAALLAGAEAASAKKKRQKGRQTLSKAIRARRRACERGECVAAGDEDPNCLPRCLSRTCFDRVYAGRELEPGEFDTKRAGEFDACCRNLPASEFTS